MCFFFCFFWGGGGGVGGAPFSTHHPHPPAPGQPIREHFSWPKYIINLMILLLHTIRLFYIKLHYYCNAILYESCIVFLFFFFPFIITRLHVTTRHESCQRHNVNVKAKTRFATQDEGDQRLSRSTYACAFTVSIGCSNGYQMP